MQVAMKRALPRALVISINREHALAVQGREAYEAHAVRCGAELVKAKKLLAHGQWIPWIKKNCEFNEDTAQRYMLLVKEGPNTARERHLEPRTKRQVEADRRAAREAMNTPLPQAPEEPYDPMQHLGARDATHEASDLKLYLDALRLFQAALREHGMTAAKAGSISPEGWQFIKRQHTGVRDLFTHMEGVQ